MHFSEVAHDVLTSLRQLELLGPLDLLLFDSICVNLSSDVGFLVFLLGILFNFGRFIVIPVFLNFLNQLNCCSLDVF